MTISYLKRVLLNIGCTSLLVFSRSLSSADIVTDINAASQHQAEVTTTSSNVPMVNIVAPNSSGLSHNKFERYAVTPQHLILNNSLQSTQTLISNTVRANPKLNQRAANIILNEVTGSNRSLLQGYSEIAGQQAELIIANPNGITCQGCGFINTPRVVLSTGTPNIQNNRLMSLTVNQGDIALSGGEVNTGNVDQFDLITRSVKISSPVLAKKLNVITGTNTVDYQSLAVTPGTGVANPPQQAIDSALLGGMYANTISLVSTESGVGVKLDGEMATNTGNVTLSADGEITINSVNAAQTVNISSNHNINTQQLLYGQNIQLKAGQNITNSGLIAASKSITTQSNTLNNQQDIIAGLNPDASLNNQGEASFTATTVNNTGQLVATKDLAVTSDQINNSNALISAGNNITVNATHYTATEKHGLSAGKKLIVNTTNFNNANKFGVDSDLQVNATQQFTNSGELSTTGAFTLNANSYQNQSSGKLTIDGNSQIVIKQDFNHEGVLKGNSQTQISAANINNKGVIASGGDLTIQASDTLTNGSAQGDSSVNALLFSVGQMNLFSNVFNNVYSDIYSIGDIAIAKNTLGEQSFQVNNLSSAIESNGNITIATQSLVNRREPIKIKDASLLCQNVGDVLSALCQFTLHGNIQGSGLADNTSIQNTWLFDEVFQFWNKQLSQIDQQAIIYDMINRVIKAALRTPSLTAGKNIFVEAGDILNQAGVFSAGDSIQLNANNFEHSTVAAMLPYPVPLDLLSSDGYNSDGGFSGIDDIWYLFENYQRYIDDKLCCSFSDDDFYNDHISSINDPLADKNPSFNYLTEAQLINLYESGSQNYIDYIKQLKQIDSARLEQVRKSQYENTINLSQSEFDQYIEKLQAFKNDQMIVENSHYLALIQFSYNWDDLILPGYALYRKIADYTLFPAVMNAGNAININAANNINLGISQIIPVQPSNAHNIKFTSAQVTPKRSANTSLSSQSSQLTGAAGKFGGLNNGLPATGQFNPVSVDTRVPTNSGLFRETNGDGFLITTNDSVASFVDQFGSDFLLQELGYNPDKVSKRLGDGFYESTLIRKTIQKQTEKRFLSDQITSDKQQFKYLMENAVAAQKALNLSIGVKLTGDQVAVLTHDMVWLEEQMIQGQQVLVPVLYLASLRDGDINEVGQISAKNISLSSHNLNNALNVIAQNKLDILTKGRFNNDGRLISGGNLAINSGDTVTNSGGIYSERSLYVKTAGGLITTGAMLAKNDIQLSIARNLNASQSLILAGNDLLAKVNGNINLASSIINSRNTTLNADNLSVSHSAINASNSLQTITKRNINLDRSQLNTDNLSLAAEGGSLITNQTRLQAKENLFLKAQGDIQTSANIKVNQSVSINAGRDFINQGKNIDAGKDITLAAGRDLKLDAVTLKKEVKQSTQPELLSKGLFGQKSPNTETTQTIEETIAGKINAQENVNLISGRNMDIKNTDITANKNIAMNAKGNTTITNTHNKIQAGKNLTINSEINADGSIGIRQSGDVTITGSPLKSGGSMSIAGSNITIDTVTETQQTGDGDHLRKTTTHTGSNLQASGDITLNAENNLNIKASEIKAQNNVALNAKDNLLVANEQNATYTYDKNTRKKRFKRKETTVRESLQRTNVESKITAGNNVTFNSQLNKDGSITTQNSGSVNVISSDIKATGHVVMAGDGINVLAQKELDYSNETKKKSSFFGLKKSSSSERRVNEILRGSNVNALTKDVNLLSKDNITIVGSNLKAAGNTNLKAQGDINIVAGVDELLTRSASSKSGFFSGGDVYTQQQDQQTRQQQSVVQSQLEGTHVNLESNQNVNLIGSNVNAQEQLNISGQNVRIASAEQITTTQQQHSKLDVGLGNMLKSLTRPDQLIKLDDGKLTVQVARSQLDKSSENTTQSTQVASLLQAGNINISANSQQKDQGNIAIVGSTLTSPGDINLSASRNITIEEAMEYAETQKKQLQGSAEMKVVVQHQAVEVIKALDAVNKSKKGLKQAQAAYDQYQVELNKLDTQLSQWVELKQNGQGGINQDDINELQMIIDDLKNDKKWYQANITSAQITLALSSTSLIQQTNAAVSSSPTLGFNVGLELEIDATKTKSDNDTTLAKASNVSGHNVNIQSHNDTAVQGSNIQASEQLNILANQLAIRSSQNTSQSSNKTEHGNVTISQTIHGASSGPTISAALDTNQQNASSSTQNNSQLLANNINIKTTKDATIKGANLVASNKLKANIGGNLNLESVYDRSKSKEAGKSIGISIGIGNGSKSLNLGNSKANSRNRTVNQQTTIQTGDGGFDINVAGNTKLRGSVIKSSEKAIANNQNQLNTETLESSDMRNMGRAEAMSAGIGIDLENSNNAIAQNVAGQTLQNLSGSNASSRATIGKTVTAISNANITIKDNAKQQALTGKNVEQTIASLNSDTNSTHTIANKVNVQDVQQALAIRNNMSHLIQAEAFKAVGDIGVKMGWKDGSPEKTALHAITAGVLSTLNGGDLTSSAAAAGLNEYLSPYMKDMDSVSQVLLAQVIGGITAAVIADNTEATLQGANISKTATVNNRLLHTEEILFIKNNAEKFAEEQGISVAEAEKRLANQAYLQVQAGMNKEAEKDDSWWSSLSENTPENWDSSAYRFIKKSGIQNKILESKNGEVVTAFYADSSQKTNTYMFGETLVDNIDFYQRNGLTIPTADKVDAWSERYHKVSDKMKVGVIAAPIVAAAPLVAALGPELAAWTLSNLNKATEMGIISAETAAEITTGATIGVSSAPILAEKIAGKTAAKVDSEVINEAGQIKVKNSDFIPELIEDGIQAAVKNEAQVSAEVLNAVEEVNAGKVVSGGSQSGQKLGNDLNSVGLGSGQAGDVNVTNSTAQNISGNNLGHINGALGEAHGWKNALDAGHIGIKAPGKVTAPGVDFVTFNPKSGRVILWDSKYRGPGGSYPSSVPESKLPSWTNEARAAANAMPDGALKNQVLNALANGDIDARVFRWPPE